MKNVVLVGLLVGVMAACSGSGSSTSSTSGGGTGSGCNGPADCPGGFACLVRTCVASCPRSSTVSGCVVGAQCIDGACVKNTQCSETTDCAFDKGEVCNFATGMCEAAADSCTEGEQETLCTSGYLCHVKVCYSSCQGSKGCPAAKTCGADHACH